MYSQLRKAVEKEAPFSDEEFERFTSLIKVVNLKKDEFLFQEGEIDPSFVITHTVSLEDGPGMYKTFRDKEDGCIKVVLKP